MQIVDNLHVMSNPVFCEKWFFFQCRLVKNTQKDKLISSQNGSQCAQKLPGNVCDWKKKGKRKVQGVSQLQTAVLPRHQEEEETDKTKQTQIEQTYEKH